MSSVRKNSAISGASGAPPEMADAEAAAELLLHLRVDEPVGDAVCCAPGRRGSGSSRSLYGIARGRPSAPSRAGAGAARRRVELGLDRVACTFS